MPFDGTGFQDKTTAFEVGTPGLDLSNVPGFAKINAVIDLLSNPDKWCKGALQSYDGRFCIRGAVMKVGATDMLEPIILASIHELHAKFRWIRRIEVFNDDPPVTHEQVLEVLSLARKKIIDQEFHKVQQPPPRQRFKFFSWA